MPLEAHPRAPSSLTKNRGKALSIQVLVERFHDNRSEGAVGQADIRAFYDSIPTHRVVRDLISKGFDAASGHGILRFSSCLPVIFENGNVRRVMQWRTSGVLTGTRVAAALSRYIVSTIVARIHPRISHMCFSAGDVPLIMSSWVDNLYFTGRSIVACQSVVRTFNSELQA